MIPDLINRYKKLVDIENNPKIVSVPPVDIYTELAREWFGRSNISFDDRHFIMQKLKTELDRQAMFNSMHEKFGTHA
jgi:hypothetical protein